MSNPSITADKTPWYQWDTGLTVTVSGGAMTECHFANRKQGTAYVQAVINGVARVPDELLQVAAPIKVYGYVSDGAGGQTYVEQTFEVIVRNIPSDYTYTKTAQKTIRDAEQARDEAVQTAKDAKASELAADDSAVEASNSAQSACDSASAAATSASNAAKSAGEAAKSASDAKAAASKAVEDASELLKTYTDNAKTSADNAATSASNAADAASAASGSASAAEQSATDASNAKVEAQTAKAEAEAAKSEAATSASNAAESATAAAKSASAAAASVGAINVIAPKNVPAAASSVPTSIAIGNGVTANFVNSVNVGGISQGSYSTVVGIGAEVPEGSNASVAVGYQSIAYGINQFAVGGPERQREIVGVKDPTNKTSASTKKYTDDNDTKTLTEAKKYTDDNTSNALVGNVSGKLLHVEDSWPSKPMSLTIDGAYKQDGTPSPENPVPITVVENPVLHVTGKNLFDYKDSKYWGENVTSLDGDELILKQSIVSVLNAPLVSGSNFTIGAMVKSYVNVSGALSLSAMAGKGVSYDAKNAYFINTGVTDKYKYTKGSFSSTNEWASINTTCTNIKNVQVEYGTKATAYKPYVGAYLPITLPAEHPYLAKLPNGTADTIEVDKDGNVSLVARVGKSQLAPTNLAVQPSVNGADGTKNRVVVFGNMVGVKDITSASGCTTRFLNGGSTQNAGTVRIGYGDAHVYLYTNDEAIIGDGSSDAVNAWLAEHPTDVLHPITPVTYTLGKLDIPALPENISNVYISGELTTDMSMTYKRDINIAFDNLVQAVVAAAAGE